MLALLLCLVQDPLPEGALFRLGPAAPKGGSAGAHYAADGSYVAWAVGAEVRLYNATKGTLTRTLKNGADAVRAARLTSSNDIVSLTEDGKIWFSSKDPDIRPWSTVPPLSTVINKFLEFDEAGSSVLARSAEGLLYLGPRPWTRLNMESKDLVALALGPGLEMAVACESGKLFLHDLENASPIAETPKPVVRLVFSSDGGRLAGATSDGKIYAWDVQKRKVLLDGAAVHEGGVRGIAWIGKRLATAGVDGAVRFWNDETGKAEQVLKGHEGPLLSLSARADGKRLVTAGEDGHALIWSLP